MPNPVKPNIRISGKLTGEHYAVLGQTVAAWSHVELWLAFIIAQSSSSRVRSILFLFQNMTTRAKLDSSEAVLETEIAAFSTNLANDIRPLLAEARALAPLRHAAAHANWLGLSGRGAMIAVSIEARGERAQIGRISWQKREFEAAIGRLEDLASRLQAIGSDLRRERVGLDDPGHDFGDPDFT